jgi:hypothetical protein
MSSFNSYKLLGVDVTHTETTAAHELGCRVTHQDGGEYVYVLADGTGATAGQTVKLLANFVVSASGTGYVFGVAHVALPANTYGWVKTRGVVTALVTTSLASGSLVCGIAATGSKLQAPAAVAESGSTAHAIGAQTLRGVTLSAESSGSASVYLQ